jgi:hypothetical protein
MEKQMAEEQTQGDVTGGSPNTIPQIPNEVRDYSSNSRATNSRNQKMIGKHYSVSEASNIYGDRGHSISSSVPRGATSMLYLKKARRVMD